MKRFLHIAALILLLLVMAFAFCWAGGGRKSAPDPAQNAVFTSFRCITTLGVAPDGALWAGTSGGVLRRDPLTQEWTTYTRNDGLPAHETRSFTFDSDGGVTARFALGKMSWNKDAGRMGAKDRAGTSPAPTPLRSPISTLQSEGGIGWGLPPGATGAYVTGVAATTGGETLTVLWNDAHLYRKRDGIYTKTAVELPGGAARELTAIAESNDGTLWLGTRRHGLWEGKNGVWKPVAPTQTGPFDHNAQAMTLFRGDLFVSTLEDGLTVRTADGWRHFGGETLSSDSPRQMVVFQNRLYVRHGNGVVDAFDGATWTRAIFAGKLPRKQASALATDGDRLYIAQWGGWSAWDGATWTHHLGLPALQGVPITALLPEPARNTLYVGTQGRGLAEIDLNSGEIRRWHNEGNNLPDDWITVVARDKNRLLVGTFVGGMAFLREGASAWELAPDTEGENITDIAAVSGVIYAATRHGVRSVVSPPPSLVADPSVEAQCLCAAPTGLWVGTRTGIYFVKSKLSSP